MYIHRAKNKHKRNNISYNPLQSRTVDQHVKAIVVTARFTQMLHGRSPTSVVTGCLYLNLSNTTTSPISTPPGCSLIWMGLGLTRFQAAICLQVWLLLSLFRWRTAGRIHQELQCSLGMQGVSELDNLCRFDGCGVLVLLLLPWNIFGLLLGWSTNFGR